MRYYHIIRRRKRRTLGLTLAVNAEATAMATYQVKCGVAYCAPVEENFSRPLGRTISKKRMEFTQGGARGVPSFKQFHFHTKNLDGLKIKALRELLGFVPIKWARGLIKSEIEAMTEAWKKRKLQDVAESLPPDLGGTAVPPKKKRLVAKIRRPRNGVSAKINVRIKETVARQPGSTLFQILMRGGFEEVKTPKKAVGYQLKHMVTAGELRRDGVGGKRDPYRYYLQS